MHILTTSTYRIACLALVSLLSVACTGVPISSMYSLSKIDPLKTDPEQIRVAIRVHDSVNTARGSAQITIGFKAEDGSIDEEHEFDVQLTRAQSLTPALTKGLLPDERVTVMSLSAEDAHTMRNFQQRLYQYKVTNGNDAGEGSFGLHVKILCLDNALPDGDIPLTLFLKTESHDDYIVSFKTELRDMFSDTDSDIEKLTFCDVPATDDV